MDCGTLAVAWIGLSWSRSKRVHRDCGSQTLTVCTSAALMVSERLHAGLPYLAVLGKPSPVSMMLRVICADPRALLAGRYLKQAAPGQTGGADDDARREACRLALVFAQRWNAWVEEAGAQAAAISGWQAVVEVTITRRREPPPSLIPDRGTR